MDTTIISALIATFTAIVISIITNYFGKKNMLKFEEKKLKQQYYMAYIRALSDNMNENSDEVVIQLNHAFNNLLVIANAEAIRALFEYNDLIINHLKYDNVENFKEKSQYALTKFIKAMRKDLYSYNLDEDLPTLYFLRGVIK